MQQVQPIHDTLVNPHAVHEPDAIPSYHTSIPHTQSTPTCVTLPSRYTTQQHAHRVVYRMYLSRVSQPACISHCDLLAGKLRLVLIYYYIRRSKTLGTQSRTQQAAAERRPLGCTRTRIVDSMSSRAPLCCTMATCDREQCELLAEVAYCERLVHYRPFSVRLSRQDCCNARRARSMA